MLTFLPFVTGLAAGALALKSWRNRQLKSKSQPAPFALPAPVLTPAAAEPADNPSAPPMPANNSAAATKTAARSSSKKTAIKPAAKAPAAAPDDAKPASKAAARPRPAKPRQAVVKSDKAKTAGKTEQAVEAANPAPEVSI